MGIGFRVQGQGLGYLLWCYALLFFQCGSSRAASLCDSGLLGNRCCRVHTGFSEQ